MIVLGEIKVNLGSWDRKLPGFINVDLLNFGQEVVANLEGKLPFKDGSVDFVFSNHFIEHIPDTAALFREVHRVLRKGGKFEFFVPHYKTPVAYLIQHKRLFSWSSFEEWAVNEEFVYGGNEKKQMFKVKKNELFLVRGNPLNLLINLYPKLWEFLFPATEIHCVLEKA